jgi:hypothetical protein
LTDGASGAAKDDAGGAGAAAVAFRTPLRPIGAAPKYRPPAKAVPVANGPFPDVEWTPLVDQLVGARENPRLKGQELLGRRKICSSVANLDAGPIPNAPIPVVPENSIRQDSRCEGESDHHPM